MTDRSRIPNAFLDDLAKLATNAAGLAQGAREEAEAVIKSRMERFFASRDLVTREEFEAIRAVAIKAREDADLLEARVAALEKRLSDAS